MAPRKRLSKCRKVQQLSGVSQRQLARWTGASRSEINYLLSGKRGKAKTPEQMVLKEQIAKYLSTSYAALWGEI